MKGLKNNILCAAGAAILTSASVHGAALINESFDYTAGDNLNGKGPATGVANAWTAENYGLESGSLTFGSLQTSGNKARWNPGDNGAGTGGGYNLTAAGIDSSLSNAGLLDNSNSLWFSFVHRMDATGGSFNFALAADPYTGNNSSIGEGVGVEFNGSGAAIATFYNGGTLGADTASNNTFGVGVTQLFVGRIDWSTGSGVADTLTLFAPGTDLDLTGHEISTASADFDQTQFDTLTTNKRREGANSYDEIRFGASYADVSPVPEPSSFALIAICLSSLSLLRRRRM
ncbi:MAG TPA: PEP-CTERM sorting domain-containing protein [Opitutales bacterium]|nr:PEP-CTERM sorting domain-containing protein [Opitutales bacterium]